MAAGPQGFLVIKLGFWPYGVTGVWLGGGQEAVGEEENDAEDIHELTVVDELADITDMTSVLFS